MAPRGDIEMLKAAKLTLAALFVAGSCGLAAAQTGNAAGASAGAADSGGVSTDKPANKDTIGTSKQQSQQMQNKGSAPAMQQKNTGMGTDRQTGATNPANAGPDEAGTAKDTAGSGTQRNPAAQKQ
jgi:hypothetical protein